MTTPGSAASAADSAPDARPTPDGMLTVLAAAGGEVIAEPLDCPGPGFAHCRDNWGLIQPGWTRQQVVDVLGEPSDRLEPQIFVDRVTQVWNYDGGMVEFSNMHVTEVVVPEHFGISAKVTSP